MNIFVKLRVNRKVVGFLAELFRVETTNRIF